MRHILSAGLLFYCLSVNAQTQLDATITDRMENKHISGLSALLVQDDEIVWYKNYGLANRQDSIPVNENTIFMLASISKTITATALMQLYEDGYFLLDDKVSDYLPFEVVNPNYPDSVITIRQLLTHTSSIKDNWDVFTYYDGDAPITLGDFLFSYLSSDGGLYDAELNFYNYSPNTTYNYCNIAVALCGYLVERMSGIPFNEYCNANIFEPLCMENTGWFLSEIDDSLVAHPYSYYSGAYHDNGLYGYADYPDGQLRTTAVSLAKFMWAHMHYGNFDGYQLLDSSTVALMRSEIIPYIDPTQGIVFYKYEDEYGTWWGHSGGDAGVSTNMFFNEETKTGLITLTNGDANHDMIWYDILSAIDTFTNLLHASISCSISFPTSILNTETSQFYIYPNPASQMYTVTSTHNDVTLPLIMMYDLTGNIIRSFEKTNVLSLAGIANGIYVLKGVNEENEIVCTQKLMITR